MYRLSMDAHADLARTCMRYGCKSLGEYSWLVENIRDGQLVGRSMIDAIDGAIERMPEGFLIRPYLLAHKAEVRDMLLTEYNEEEAMQLFREEGREKTTANHLSKLMRSLGVTAAQAMDILDVPVAERTNYLSMLQA